MSVSQRGLAVLQQDNGASHSAKESVLIQTTEERRDVRANGDDSDASILPDTTNESVEGTAVQSAAESGDGVPGPPQDETASSASIKKTQSVEHISWMARRIDTLEKELHLLRTENFQKGSMGQQLEKEAQASHDEFDREQNLQTRNVNLDEFRGIKDKYEVTKGSVILCAKAERREVSVQISAEKETMVPYRVAINSYCVLDLLAMFHKTASLYNVHLRPFKFLLCYQKELRQKLKHLNIQCKEGAKQELERECVEEHGLTETPEPKESQSNVQKSDLPDGVHERSTDSSHGDLNKKQLLRDHLSSLVNFIDNEMDEIFRRRKILDEAGQEDILFEDLYHLFRPGQLVYTNPGQDPASRRAYRVLHVTGGRSIRDIAGNIGVDKDGSEPGGKLEEDLFRFSPESAGQTQQRVPGTTFKMSPVLIDCVYIDYDGEFYSPRSLRFVILEYEGTRPIRHLDIYPAHFDRDPEGTKAMLIARGERFVASAAAQHKTYTGRPLADRNVFMEEINGEVILDHGQKMNSDQHDTSGDEFLEEPSKWDRREAFKSTALDPAALGTDLWWDYEVDERLRKDFLESEDGRQILVIAEAPEEEQLLLLPVRIWGYVLTERKWRQLNINNIKDVQRKSNVDDGAIRSFNDLVLPPKHKKLIQALVTHQMWLQSANLTDADTKAVQTRYEQFPGQSTSLDIVRGKGRGLIILLHGVPGVGKTSTAECVAAQLGRPLFPITCGDLGTDAATVEDKLDTFFFLAQKWKCVLLLDEADVFLTRCSTGDFVRNGIVSVFLRVLETFTGVLILTTNRVGEFDEAFRSRIHVSILYPRLDEESTVGIYDVNLRRIKENESLAVDVEEEAIREFGRQHFQNNETTPSRRWTGRQIKNAFQTGIALANWDFYDQGHGSSGMKARPTLQAKHFDFIAKTSADFDEYLDRVHQSSGAGGFAEMAADYRLRHDEFESLTPIPERSRSLRGRNSSITMGSIDALSPVATSDDHEMKIKKLRSKLKNVHKLGLPSEQTAQMRLDLLSEIDELEADDGPSMTSGGDDSSEKAPWLE